jgi:hypothetical protein
MLYLHDFYNMNFKNKHKLYKAPPRRKILGSHLSTAVPHYAPVHSCPTLRTCPQLSHTTYLSTAVPHYAPVHSCPTLRTCPQLSHTMHNQLTAVQRSYLPTCRCPVPCTGSRRPGSCRCMSELQLRKTSSKVPLDFLCVWP